MSSTSEPPGKQWYCSPVSQVYKGLIEEFIEKCKGFEEVDISTRDGQAHVTREVIIHLAKIDSRYNHMNRLEKDQPRQRFNSLKDHLDRYLTEYRKMRSPKATTHGKDFESFGK